MGNQHNNVIKEFDQQKSRLQDDVSIDKSKIFHDFKKDLKKHYKLQDKIGHTGVGGLSELFSVVHLETNTERAMKIIRKKYLGDNVVELLIREVEFLEQCSDHPNCLKLHEGFEDHRSVYLILDKRTGGTLANRILRKSITPELIASVTAQVAGVLEAMHDRGIVHCDLKPSNIVFKEENNDKIVLVGFGLSERCGRFEWLKKIGGTPSYVAPELLNRHYTQECDVWALGIIVFECFYGYPPFATKPNPLDIIRNAAKGFHPVTKGGPGPWFNKKFSVSKAAKHFITRCLDLKPDMRLTAREALVHPFLKKYSCYTPRQLLIDNLTHHAHASQLGKFVTALLNTSELPPKMLKEYRKLFDELRREQGRSKTLTWDRFQIAVSRITKQYFETQDLKKIFDDMDLKNNDQIDVDEFLQYCTFQYYRQQDDRFCNLLIDHLDPERKGYVKVKTFAKLIKSNKEIYQKFDINFIEEVSKLANTQGHIDYHTLATYLDKNESQQDLEPFLENEKEKHKTIAGPVLDKEIVIAAKIANKLKSVNKISDRFTTPLKIKDEKT